MTAIVAQVQRVVDLIGEISSATLGQASGVFRVNRAVTQLDQMTQQNWRSLSRAPRHRKAGKLTRAVAVFHV